MVSLSKLSLAIRLIQPGARLHPIATIPFYGCALWLALVGSEAGVWGQEISQMATFNALLQFGLFVVIVQIPCFLTGIMSNVDLAWPIGLVSLAVQVLRYHFHNFGTDASFWYSRSFWLGVALLLHGGRMALGAIVLFYPYNWPDGDLSRYKYAKKRWIEETGASSLWWLKQQQETLLQAYANSVLIATPVILVGTNPNHPGSLRPLEVIGFASWLVCSVLENMSDFQKMRFTEAIRSDATASRTAVLGFAPYDGTEYWLWRECRHPNYFFEYMCWYSLILLSIPSALDLVEAIETNHVTTNPWMVRALQAGIWILLVCLNRALYDCLLYWTGAEPAESRSVTRRPKYKDYQKTTNIFFPVSIPFFDHHRNPGWPIEKAE